MAKNKDTAKTTSVAGATRQAQRVGIFGASGCGKTTKARELTGKLSRVIYIDPMSEWCREKGVKPFISLDKLKQALKRNFALGFRYAYIPPYGDEEQALQELSSFLVYLQSGYGDTHDAQLTLVIDELDVSFSTGSMQKNRKNAFGFLCCRGRHYGINIIGISQRMHLIDNVFRANCSVFYLFRHSEPADIDTCIKLIGNAYRADFSRLANFQYVYKSQEKIFVKK